MNETVTNFLDLLTPQQLEKLSSIIDDIEEEEKYASLANEMGMSVNGVKTAEFLTSLVNEGFMDGLDELSGVGNWNDFLNRGQDHE